MGAIIEQTVEESIRGEVYEAFGQLEAFHPEEPHWFLPLIGVVPEHQSKGIVGAPIDIALEACDSEGCLAYLDASSPRSAALYARHGFEPQGEVQVGSGPPIVPVVRPAR